jgi:hypothetical protein
MKNIRKYFNRINSLGLLQKIIIQSIVYLVGFTINWWLIQQNKDNLIFAFFIVGVMVLINISLIYKGFRK